MEDNMRREMGMVSKLQSEAGCRHGKRLLSGYMVGCLLLLLGVLALSACRPVTVAEKETSGLPVGKSLFSFDVLNVKMDKTFCYT